MMQYFFIHLEMHVLFVSEQYGEWDGRGFHEKFILMLVNPGKMYCLQLFVKGIKCVFKYVVVCACEV